MQYFGNDDEAECWQECKQKSAGADRCDRNCGEETFGNNAIDQRAGGNLQRETGDRADGKDETDVELRPGDRRQIGRNERSPAGLNIGDEKGKPVETAEAASRGHGST